MSKFSKLQTVTEHDKCHKVNESEISYDPTRDIDMELSFGDDNKYVTKATNSNTY